MQKMVNELSASLCLQNEEPLPVLANHYDMIKYPNESDHTYMAIVYWLQDCLKLDVAADKCLLSHS